MTPAERAIAWVQIFIGAEQAGRDWRDFVPVDAEIVANDRIRVDGIEVRAGDDGVWFVTDESGKVTKWKVASS